MISKYTINSFLSRPCARGKIVQFPPSPLSSEESIKVQCGRHEKWVDVDYKGLSFEGPYELNEKVAEAFDKCPDCINERAYETSRFPEGAEL